MQLDRDWIEGHIPHHGKMCLLDEVLSWDIARARCRANSHRSLDNPLRAFGRLSAACGIEYAAQTMAVHGALIASSAGAAAPRGFLASVRNVDLHVDRLDDVEGDLVMSVERVAGDERTALYEFAVLSPEQVLLNGRAAVLFDDL
jgi:predicted hotdog family 3-hydroxylacyl-ACP dehydratase